MILTLVVWRSSADIIWHFSISPILKRQQLIKSLRCSSILQECQLEDFNSPMVPSSFNDNFQLLGAPGSPNTLSFIKVWMSETSCLVCTSLPSHSCSPWQNRCVTMTYDIHFSKCKRHGIVFSNLLLFVCRYFSGNSRVIFSFKISIRDEVFSILTLQWGM